MIESWVVILIMVFAPQIVGFLAPSYRDYPEKMALAVLLTRIMAPLLMVVSWAALFMGALNSFKVFFWQQDRKGRDRRRDRQRQHVHISCDLRENPY